MDCTKSTAKRNSGGIQRNTKLERRNQLNTINRNQLLAASKEFGRLPSHINQVQVTSTENSQLVNTAIPGSSIPFHSTNSRNSCDTSFQTSKREPGVVPSQSGINNQFQNTSFQTGNMESESSIFEKMTFPKMIVPNGFPESRITIKQFSRLKILIMNAIDKIKFGPFPKFGKLRLRGGAILVDCLDEFTRVWLINQSPRFGQVMGGLLLTIADPYERQKYVKAEAWIEGQPEESELILRFIKNQNPNLDSSGWKVFQSDKVPLKIPKRQKIPSGYMLI